MEGDRVLKGCCGVGDLALNEGCDGDRPLNEALKEGCNDSDEVRILNEGCGEGERTLKEGKEGRRWGDGERLSSVVDGWREGSDGDRAFDGGCGDGERACKTKHTLRAGLQPGCTTAL